MKNNDSKSSTNEKLINSLVFEKELWEKVKLSLAEDGTKIVENAVYEDDPCFPMIHVRGFNELNGEEESSSLYLYCMYEDSRREMREWYEETGQSPAFDFPLGVETAIFTRIINIRTRLAELGYHEEDDD